MADKYLLRLKCVDSEGRRFNMVKNVGRIPLGQQNTFEFWIPQGAHVESAEWVEDMTDKLPLTPVFERDGTYTLTVTNNVPVDETIKVNAKRRTFWDWLLGR